MILLYVHVLMFTITPINSNSMSISIHVEDKSIIYFQKNNYEYCRFSLTPGIGLQTHFIFSSQYSKRTSPYLTSPSTLSKQKITV